MKLSLILLSLAVSGSAFAQGGSGVGNGGSGVVCFKKDANGKRQISKAYSLDLWEATHESDKLQIDLGSSQLTEFEKVALLIERVSRVDPTFGAELNRRFSDFRKSYEVQKRVRITKIDDTKTLVDPKGDCEIYQIAVQKRVVDAFFDKKFLFDQDVWEKMSRNERAGLIFHEILYWSEIERGAEDSFGVRRVVGAFASQFGSQITLPDYLDMIRKHLRHGHYDFNGLNLSLSSSDKILFDSNQNIIQARVSNATQIVRNGSTSNEVYIYSSIAERLYRFNEKREMIEGALLLVQVKRTFSNQIVRFMIRSDQQSEASFKSGYTTAQLAEISDQVLIERFDFLNMFSLKPQDSKLFLSADGRARAVYSSDPKDFQFLTEFPSLRFENAKVVGLLFSNEDQLSGFLVEAKTKGFIYDDSKTNGKYELSWKPSGIYEVMLDFSTKTIQSVR